MKKIKPCVGWREWVQLPALHIDAIDAKVDTGAKTCALHACYVEPYTKANNEQWVKFGIHPSQNSKTKIIECHAKLLEQRRVKNSGGQDEQRYVIVTPITIGTDTFECEITLTDRETMRFRMLLGRNALSKRFIVDPSRSYLLNRPTAKKLTASV